MNRVASWKTLAITGIAAMMGCVAEPSVDDAQEPGQARSPVVGATDEAAALGAPDGCRVSLALRAAGDAPLGDRAAAQCFDAVRDVFARGAEADLALGVYSLEPPGDAAARVRERAVALGLGASEPASTNGGRALGVQSGDLELLVNVESGAELFVDHARFHRDDGVDTADADGKYVDLARAHLEGSIPDALAGAPYPYKLRRYYNEVAGAGEVATRRSVYQVAVAFNTSVDDLPVIGPGGKVAVHLSVGGEVLSHESSVQPIGALAAVARGADLIAPDEARRLVEERLRSEGIRPEEYSLVRAELGYLRRGRSSVQSVVAPHYAFAFEPPAGSFARRRVEVVPALREGDTLDRVRADQRAEDERKARRKAGADPDDTPRP